MTPERAHEIVATINRYAFYTMGLYEPGQTLGSLEGVTLAEMLEAKAWVELDNETRPAIDGKRTIHVVPDDRLIAAAYVINHYQADSDAILMLPRQDWFQGTDHVAVAVVALKRAGAEQDEEAA